ncbi:MAG: nucleoid occlusion factor SlmA [Porticoccaceae bacterium]|jgi:TetR/AcrR family transcriptional regulator|nr:nucleoid occlusion factor SlmA [Porticoccaceae bacterium]MBT3798470.1 nucleoid occlusion factor SlmA [Porticoccaceae bacterium]MBT4163450.1 nucleoid occlusion factor SlmA [Porticoccaceae bacterium]MBT4211467.1 nucleoid occlusion factor SlmA [Porticoccaceae bacterium]MBT5102505.1 nucleoid occlusion factor SlmA [Porticoccaceae bacterium]|tara:strand:+ start:282 stop:869 length:588 start_codon:yes stop_codon:yes gene_type:complete
MAGKKGTRAQEILQALARMLETSKGRITTAALAAELGISEAALYRHFPSKTRMYESLIDFIEETIFGRVRSIVSEEPDAVNQCYRILSLVIAFCQKNPGITRILNGDALAIESEKLHSRVAQFFDRLESQLKQALREAEVRDGLKLNVPVSVAANLMLVSVEGKISQYVRSDFATSPNQHWPEQWQLLTAGIFES